MRRQTFHTIGLLALAILVGACGADAPVQEEASSTANDYRGLQLAEPAHKADFTLTDTEGEPFRFRDETDGKLTLLFFGYTSCPDICPVHMANLAAVLDNLAWEDRQRVRVVFVTTDPARDTPERIRKWLDAFDSSFVGLTGDREKVNRIQESLGLAPSIIQGDTASGQYGVGHASLVIAFSPDNLARVVYPFGTRQADWAHDLPKLLKQEGRVRVGTAVAAAPVGGNDRTALYITLENRSAEDDDLIGVATDVTGRAEVHRTGDGGMQPVDTLRLPAHETVRFRPGGLHVMLSELRRPLAPGDSIRVELRFRRSGSVRTTAQVHAYEQIEHVLAGDRSRPRATR